MNRIYTLGLICILVVLSIPNTIQAQTLIKRNLNSIHPCDVTGVSETESRELQIYPNPNSGEFVLNSTIQGNAIIFDGNGQFIHAQSILIGRNAFKMNRLAAGVYTVLVVDRTTYYRIKLIIRK